MTDNLKKSIKKANIYMGRPQGKIKREVRLRWASAAADCLEKHHDWIEKNFDWIDEMAGSEDENEV